MSIIRCAALALAGLTIAACSTSQRGDNTMGSATQTKATDTTTTGAAGQTGTNPTTDTSGAPDAGTTANETTPTNQSTPDQ